MTKKKILQKLGQMPWSPLHQRKSAINQANSLMMLWIYRAEVADLQLFYQYKYGESFNNQMQVRICTYRHLSFKN